MRHVLDEAAVTPNASSRRACWLHSVLRRRARHVPPAPERPCACHLGRRRRLPSVPRVPMSLHALPALLPPPLARLGSSPNPLTQAPGELLGRDPVPLAFVSALRPPFPLPQIVKRFVQRAPRSPLPASGT